MRAGWLSSLGLALGVWVTGAAAEDRIVWRAVAPEAREPAASLGQPVPIASGRPVTPVAFSAADAGPRVVIRAQADLPPPAPPPGVTPLPPSGVPSAVPPPPPPGIPANPADLYPSGVVPDAGPSAGTGFWDKCKNVFDMQSGPFCGSGGRKPFQSDHAFDGFISPVSNPFFFEDPRALTEVRPIFMYQSIPSKNYAFNGGNIEFFGVNASVALTQSISVVMTELGGVWLHPGGGALPDYAGSRSDLVNLNLGPQWTFLRNERSGTLGAVGLLFEIPTGGSRLMEAGGLSLFPYLTMGQNFGRSSYGSFNVLGEIGYSFATDNKPTDYFMTSLHLDYDIGNLHKIYPLLELNWRYYTDNGGARAQTFEGGDLINFGANDVSGRNNLTLAPGLRYKFNESFQMGTALEFPLVGTKDIENFRWTLDFIIRY